MQVVVLEEPLTDLHRKKIFKEAWENADTALRISDLSVRAQSRRYKERQGGTPPSGFARVTP